MESNSAVGINSDVSDFIEIISKSVQKEIVFITNKDWTALESLQERIELHNIQRLLTDRNIKHAIKLHGLADISGDLGKPFVKKAMEELFAFYDIYEARYDLYVDAQDWTSYIDGGETNIKNPEKEIQFSSEVAKWVTQYKSEVSKMRAIDDGSIVNISTQKDIPIPFLMRVSVEERHIDVGELMVKKLEDGI